RRTDQESAAGTRSRGSRVGGWYAVAGIKSRRLVRGRGDQAATRPHATVLVVAYGTASQKVVVVLLGSMSAHAHVSQKPTAIVASGLARDRDRCRFHAETKVNRREQGGVHGGRASQA